jgi:hypothetical protein
VLPELLELAPVWVAPVVSEPVPAELVLASAAREFDFEPVPAQLVLV